MNGFVGPIFCGLLTLCGRHQCQQKDEDGIDQSHEIKDMLKEDMVIVVAGWSKKDVDSALIKALKKEGGVNSDLHAGQPVNADGSAGGVAPELDELLDGEDTSEVLDVEDRAEMAADASRAERCSAAKKVLVAVRDSPDLQRHLEVRLGLLDVSQLLFGESEAVDGLRVLGIDIEGAEHIEFACRSSSCLAREDPV
jgi:hypothetical protein